MSITRFAPPDLLSYSSYLSFSQRSYPIRTFQADSEERSRSFLFPAAVCVVVSRSAVCRLCIILLQREGLDIDSARAIPPLQGNCNGTTAC